jgi:hypothetical protein
LVECIIATAIEFSELLIREEAGLASGLFVIVSLLRGDYGRQR